MYGKQITVVPCDAGIVTLIIGVSLELSYISIHFSPRRLGEICFCFSFSYLSSQQGWAKLYCIVIGH